MATPEGIVQDTIFYEAERLQFLCLKFAVIGHMGFPDLMIIRNGIVSFIEVKAPGEKPRASQLLKLKTLRRLGVRAEYFDNADLAVAFMRTLP